MTRQEPGPWTAWRNPLPVRWSTVVRFIWQLLATLTITDMNRWVVLRPVHCIGNVTVPLYVKRALALGVKYQLPLSKGKLRSWVDADLARFKRLLRIQS